MENKNEFKKFVIKIFSCYYRFDDIIKIEDFDFDNYLSDVLYITLIGTKPWSIMFDKVDEFITDQKDLLLMDLSIKYYLALKNMMPFSKGLYIL